MEKVQAIDDCHYCHAISTGLVAVLVALTTSTTPFLFLCETASPFISWLDTSSKVQAVFSICKVKVLSVGAKDAFSVQDGLFLSRYNAK